MSSVQERLQLKRVPLDNWNVREQLCLASAVVRSGDQNWMSVSRALKTVGDPNRPADWYSQKSCAVQYGALLEHVETPKRKKRNSEGESETPQESILKRLTAERIAEIQKTLAEMNQQYQLIKTEVSEIRNPSTSEDRIKELWSGVETYNRQRERETARRAAWLREREERRARAQRSWRPSGMPNEGNTTPPSTPSSPLLTSLLKSNPVTTTPQHINHPATVVETISPSAGAPTLSMLLEKSQNPVPDRASPQESKHAAIEHIKSQLVLIEQSLRAGASPPAPLPEPPPPLDIDDIEIKAEDVYAFRDVDIEIPPVGVLHKQNNRVPEKPEMQIPKKEEAAPIPEAEPETQADVPEQAVVVDATMTEESSDEIINVFETTQDTQNPELRSSPTPDPPEMASVEQRVAIAFPEVKFPNPEIKVIQNEDLKPPEEIKEELPIREEIEIEKEAEINQPETVEESVTTEETVPEQEAEIPETVTPVPETVPEPEIAEEVPTETAELDDDKTEEIVVAEAQDPQPEPEQESVKPEVPETAIPEAEPEIETDVVAEEAAEETVDEIKKEVEEPTTQPEPRETDAPTDSIAEKTDLKPIEELQADTDDDTPMELSREEEKDGKKKRDYSRKKKPESRTCSGSESAPESSESPATDQERQHRLWRKSVMLVYSRLSAHKYASLFLRPITDELAPGYSAAVKRPIDLSAIKRNIDNGVTRTTAEFQRDVLLMLTNALMYNASEHRVYQMAREMFTEAQSELGMLLAAQAHAGLSTPAPRRRRHAAGAATPNSAPRPSKRPHL